MTAIPLQYRSGEEIKAGDSVRFHGNLAEIEFLATTPVTQTQQWLGM
jgi:hypothetical protein